MTKLIREAFAVLIAALYISIRGESETSTFTTGKTFSYTYPLETGLLKLASIEYKHVEKFKQWFLPNRIYYTYLVQVKGEGDEAIRSIPMPMLCSRLFAETTLPHRLAIAECLRLFMSS